MKNILHVLFTLMSSVVGYSQLPPQYDDSTFKEVKLNEIIISATRAPENRKNIAQPALTLSSGKIQFYSQQTLATLLEQTGRVFMQKSQLGGGSPVIRGFEANKLLIVVDGIRMNNLIFRGGHLQNVITADNAILDKAEVLFGPASVAYGSDALGGVLSFYTRNPSLSDSKEILTTGNAFVRYSSAYNEKTTHADISVGGNKLASLTSFTYSDFGDLHQGENHYSSYPGFGKRFFYAKRLNGKDSMIANSNPDIQKQSSYRQYDFLEKVLLKAGRAEHMLNVQYSTSSNIYRYDRLTEMDASGKLKSAQWYYGPQKRLLIAYHLKLGKCGFYDVANITGAYQDIEESRHNRNFSSSKLNHRIENVKVYSLNADLSKTLNKDELRYGAEIVLNDLRSTANREDIISGSSEELDTRYPDGGSHTQSYALYGIHIRKISKHVVLNDGVRLTHTKLSSKFNDKTFFPFPFSDVDQNSTALTGNIALVISSSDGWKISPLFSTGFRTPNIDDLSKVFESVSGDLIIPNPGLKPEHTYNYELNISKIFNSKIEIGANGFYTNYRNALTTAPTTFNGESQVLYDGELSNVSTTVNKAKAYIYGIGGHLAADVNKHISFSSVISYTYGRIKENPKNYPLDHIPPLFGKTSVIGSISGFTMEVFALYNSAKKSGDYNLRGEDNQLYSADAVNGYTPSWFTLNVRTKYNINRYATVQFAVENITDKFYRVFASGLSGPGRNVVITLRGKF
jgi:hemoglobin/transferrin/lactoferrin receptor protein